MSDTEAPAGIIRATWLSVRARLSNRRDSEHEQALIRLAMGAIVLVALLGFGFLIGHPDPIEVPGRVGFALFFLSAFSILGWIIVRPEASPIRRAYGILTDVLATSALLYLSGELGSGVFCLYFWITVGNGFRFGKSYLMGTAMASMVGFSTVVLMSPYWQTHKNFALSMLIALAALSNYLAILLDRLTEARRRAEDANTAKSRFIANMSHELRTPIAGVAGINELLLASKLDPQQRELVQMQSACTSALRDVINNVLYWAKIEAGRISIEDTDFDLHQLVSDVVRMFRYEARQRSLQFVSQVDSDVPYRILGDPKRLRQVLVNLVGNAFKFTERGSIEIRASRVGSGPDAERLRIEVVDSGVGIADEARERIFDRFVQEDQSTGRRFGGTGLGLAISRELVQLMDGEIGVESELGHGSRFWIEIPLRVDPSVEEHRGDVAFRSLVLGSPSDEIGRVESFVRAWSGSCVPVADPDDLYAELQSAERSGRRFTSVLVLADRLDIDLTALAKGIASNCTVQLPLVLASNAIDPVQRAHLLRQGYSGFLRLPLVKEELFNALHCAAMDSDDPSGTVVTLQNHRREPKARRTLRVLLVEDNLTNQKVTSSVLGGAGHEVVIAGSGDEALDRIESEFFDVCVIDMNMPGVSGVDVILHTRTLILDKRDLPFVVLTANATVEAREECLAAGANGFLTKPVMFAELLRTVEAVADAKPLVEAPPPVRVQVDSTIDLDEATLRDLDRIGGQPDFALATLELFVCECGELIDRIGSALRERRYEDARDAAHSVKGNAGYVGALGVMAVATRINRADTRTLREHGDELAAEMVAAFGRVRVEIERYRGHGREHNG